MPDRVLLFTHAFFPLLIAQLSLNFDVTTQIPNHLSLDRSTGTWQKAAGQNPWFFLIRALPMPKLAINLSTPFSTSKNSRYFVRFFVSTPNVPTCSTWRQFAALGHVTNWPCSTMRTECQARKNGCPIFIAYCLFLKRDDRFSKGHPRPASSLPQLLPIVQSTV